MSIDAEIKGMEAENSLRASNGEAQAYQGSDFFELSVELETIADYLSTPKAPKNPGALKENN
ncbi:MAG: hypothetical protein ACJAYB_000023 [Psychromonas sp.]|jgi:hypothetical protein